MLPSKTAAELARTTTLAPDGFPVSIADSDCQIQIYISHDIQHAPIARAEYEQRYASTDYAARMRDRLTDDKLYPKLTRAAPGSWVLAIARRLKWYESHRDSPWRVEVGKLLVAATRNVSKVTECEYIALAQCLRQLDKVEASIFDHNQTGLLDALEQSHPLSAEGAAAVRTFLEFSLDLHANIFTVHSKGIAFPTSVVWPLFRSEHGFTASRNDWAAKVHRDLHSLPVKALWLPVLDAETAFKGLRKPTKRAQQALKPLGQEHLATGLERWLDLLDVPLTMSPEGTALLHHLIQLIDQVKDDRRKDVMLGRIARLPWASKQDTGWLEAFLWVLSHRPADRAFPCLEALMMNPVTATDEVSQAYSAALGALSAEGSNIGIDGYPLDADPKLLEVQKRIEQILRLCSSAAANIPPNLHHQMINSIDPGSRSPMMDLWAAQMEDGQRRFFLPGPDVKDSLDKLCSALVADYSVANPDGLFEALQTRLEWIQGNPDIQSTEERKAWLQTLRGVGGHCGRGVLHQSLAKVESLDLPKLLRTLEQIPYDMRVIDQCERYVKTHGWTSPDLVSALRKWVSLLGSAASDQPNRARVEWFLWFEDVTPIRLDECWSQRVRQDLRNMDRPTRERWVALIDVSSFTVTAKPPKRWIKEAGKVFPRVDPSEFRLRFNEWFAPFDSGKPLRLTVAGRNVLRVLMWMALLAKDPTVDKSLLRFAKVQWKTKECARRASQAEMAFSHVLVERAPEGALEALEEIVKLENAANSRPTAYRAYLDLCAATGHTPVSSS